MSQKERESVCLFRDVRKTITKIKPFERREGERLKRVQSYEIALSKACSAPRVEAAAAAAEGLRVMVQGTAAAAAVVVAQGSDWATLMAASRKRSSVSAWTWRE